MRNHIIFLSLIATFFILSPVSNAALIDQGNGLIYDKDLNITWLQNANYSGSTMSWDEANSWTEGLIFGNYSDWRLPVSDTCSGSGCSGSEMGHLYYAEGITSNTPGPFTDVKPFMYWSSTEYTEDQSRAWRFSMKYGTQGASDKGLNRYAWAVRDGDSLSASAPEPYSAILFLSGIVTLWVTRKRNNFRSTKKG